METEALNDLDLADWIFEWDDWPEEFLEQIKARKLNGNTKEDLCVFRCPDGLLYAVAEWSKQWIHTPVDWFWGCNEADKKNWKKINKPENHIEDFSELLRYNLWREAENAEEHASYKKAHNRHWAEADKILQEFELKYQIRLPLPAFKFFQKPAYLGANYTKKPAEFTEFSLTGNWHIPRRFFTISYFPNGSMLGLFFDRVHSPAVAVHDHSSSETVLISRDFKKFFKNPEAYITESLDWCAPDKSDFSDLIINPDTQESELELLKPLTISENEELIRIEHEYNEKPRFRKKACKLIDFGTSSDPRSEIIHKQVDSPMDLLSSSVWMEIANELYSASFFVDAFRALDNAAAVRDFAPFTGNPEMSDDYKHLFSSRVYEKIHMKQIVELYEKFSSKEDPLTREWRNKVFPGGSDKMEEDTQNDDFDWDSVEDPFGN